MPPFLHRVLTWHGVRTQIEVCQVLTWWCTWTSQQKKQQVEPLLEGRGMRRLNSRNVWLKYTNNWRQTTGRYCINCICFFQSCEPMKLIRSDFNIATNTVNSLENSMIQLNWIKIIMNKNTFRSRFFLREGYWYLSWAKHTLNNIWGWCSHIWHQWQSVFRRNSGYINSKFLGTHLQKKNVTGWL